MADVFISYSPLDRARVRAVAERLTSLGYQVVWEHGARAGQVNDIEAKLDAAAVVLAVWTYNARNSTTVFAQSARALDAGKLLQLRLDEAAPPAPFDALPAADMSGERAEWGPLEHDLQRLAKGGAAPEPLARIAAPGFFATAQPLGAPKLLTSALMLTLLGFAVSVLTTYSGAMSPEQLQFMMTGLVGVGGACAAFAAYRLFIVRRSGG